MTTTDMGDQKREKHHRTARNHTRTSWTYTIARYTQPFEESRMIQTTCSYQTRLRACIPADRRYMHEDSRAHAGLPVHDDVSETRHGSRRLKMFVL